MILITGGARSGKSRLAEEMAGHRGDQVTYIATAAAGDGEMRQRIEEHRRQRPPEWRTVEAATGLPDAVAAALRDSGTTVLVDCLTVYLANLLAPMDAAGEEPGADLAGIEAEIEDLVAACRAGNGRVIVVSNEVGMGIVPDNALARRFRDLAGRANQRLAAAADEVYLCVSGLPLKVK